MKVQHLLMALVITAMMVGDLFAQTLVPQGTSLEQQQGVTLEPAQNVMLSSSTPGFAGLTPSTGEALKPSNWGPSSLGMPYTQPAKGEQSSPTHKFFVLDEDFWMYAGLFGSMSDQQQGANVWGGFFQGFFNFDGAKNATGNRLDVFSFVAGAEFFNSRIKRTKYDYSGVGINGGLGYMTTLSTGKSYNDIVFGIYGLIGHEFPFNVGEGSHRNEWYVAAHLEMRAFGFGWDPIVEANIRHYPYSGMWRFDARAGLGVASNVDIQWKLGGTFGTQQRPNPYGIREISAGIFSEVLLCNMGDSWIMSIMLKAEQVWSTMGPGHDNAGRLTLVLVLIH